MVLYCLLCSGVVEAEQSKFPETLLVKANKEQDLRYGENPPAVRSVL